MPGCSGTRDTVVNKVDKIPCLRGDYTLVVGETKQK